VSELRALSDLSAVLVLVALYIWKDDRQDIDITYICPHVGVLLRRAAGEQLRGSCCSAVATQEAIPGHPSRQLFIATHSFH
jgi:hypothetical protein